MSALILQLRKVKFEREFHSSMWIGGSPSWTSVSESNALSPLYILRGSLWLLDLLPTYHSSAGSRDLWDGLVSKQREDGTWVSLFGCHSWACGCSTSQWSLQHLVQVGGRRGGWAAYQRPETDDNLPGGAHSSKTGQEAFWQTAWKLWIAYSFMKHWLSTWGQVPQIQRGQGR